MRTRGARPSSPHGGWACSRKTRSPRPDVSPFSGTRSTLCAILATMSATPAGPTTITRTATPEDLLELARQSPAAVAVHDKKAWLGLFADRHVVEDPVGGRPVLGGLVRPEAEPCRGGEPARPFLGNVHRAQRHPVRHRERRHRQRTGRGPRRHDRNPTRRRGRGQGADAPAVRGDPRRRRAAHPPDRGALGGRADVRSGRGHQPRAKLRCRGGDERAMLRLQGLGGSLAFGPRCAVRREGSRRFAGWSNPRSAATGPHSKLLGGRAVADVTKLIAAGDAVTATWTVDGAHAVLFGYLDRKTMQVTEPSCTRSRRTISRAAPSRRWRPV